jgi:hypothetical protein
VLGNSAVTPDGEAALTPKQREDSACHKYRLKHDSDAYQLNMPKSLGEEQVDRNRLFYCTHQNRGNVFFRRHMLSAKSVTS